MTLFITGTYKLTIQNKETGLTGFYKYLSLPFKCCPYSLDTLNKFLEDFIYQQLSQCYYNFHIENVMITSWKSLGFTSESVCQRFIRYCTKLLETNNLNTFNFKYGKLFIAYLKFDVNIVQNIFNNAAL